MYKYNLNKVVEEKISMINSPISYINNVFILMFAVAIIFFKKDSLACSIFDDKIQIKEI